LYVSRMPYSAARLRGCQLTTQHGRYNSWKGTDDALDKVVPVDDVFRHVFDRILEEEMVRVTIEPLVFPLFKRHAIAVVPE
jgi:hypothetical protein